MPNCIKCQQDFVIRDEDRAFYKRFDAPDPEQCPDCRLQHRLNFRNERSLYKRTSSLSGKPLISIYDENSPYKVYAQEEWWSDKWDGMDYGQEFDFNRPFFEQFQELLLKVPRIALFNVNPTNSEYCQQAYDNKNCYMCNVLTQCQDCMYITHSNTINDSFDCSLIQFSELCYECLDSDKLYGCIGCQSCQNSSSLWFCYDCIGCQNCVGCYGLRNKQYHIMNVKYSREEYEEKLKKLQLGKHSSLLNAKNYFIQFAKGLANRANRNLNAQDCTGNYLINCHKCFNCYDCFDLQDCANSTWIFNSHDCHDVYGLGGGEWCYQGLGIEKVNNVAFSTFVSDGSDAMYSDCSFYCHDIFGCAGIRSKRNCILNKQYSKEEYESLRARIIEHMKKTGEWGQFFPVTLSPFAYNETAANYRFPLGRDEAAKQGFRWREVDKRDFLENGFELPDDVGATDASVCAQTCSCIDCKKAFKIPEKELVFHKRMNIALSRKCYDCRFMDRFKLRNPNKLYQRACGECGVAIETTFAPDRPEKIICEACYAKTVG